MNDDPYALMRDLLPTSDPAPRAGAVLHVGSEGMAWLRTALGPALERDPFASSLAPLYGVPIVADLGHPLAYQLIAGDGHTLVAGIFAGDLPEAAPALCVTGCGSPVAWAGAYCDPCDRAWLADDDAARRRDDR